MTTKQLHFKWTISRGRDTYGYNTCTLLVNGEKKGRCNGGGYDMQGTSLAQWLTNDYQDELTALFANELIELDNSTTARTYESNGHVVKFATSELYYGTTLYVDRGTYRVSLDGGCGFNSIERIANAIGIKLQWNPESNRYKNHTYYTAIIA